MRARKRQAKQGCVEVRRLTKASIVSSGPSSTMQAGSLQDAFSEATATLDAVRAVPLAPIANQAAPHGFNYVQAETELDTLRAAVRAAASRSSTLKQQPRVPHGHALEPARKPSERIKPRSLGNAKPQLAAPATALLPADPVMTAHADSVHLMDHAAFRMAIVLDVAERIRTAAVRPWPTILPPGPKQAARPAPCYSTAEGADVDNSTAQDTPRSSTQLLQVRRIWKACYSIMVGIDHTSASGN